MMIIFTVPTNVLGASQVRWDLAPDTPKSSQSRPRFSKQLSSTQLFPFRDQNEVPRGKILASLKPMAALPFNSMGPGFHTRFLNVHHFRCQCVIDGSCGGSGPSWRCWTLMEIQPLISDSDRMEGSAKLQGRNERGRLRGTSRRLHDFSAKICVAWQSSFRDKISVYVPVGFTKIYLHCGCAERSASIPVNVKWFV